jgi:hypothetical protein
MQIKLESKRRLLVQRQLVSNEEEFKEKTRKYAKSKAKKHKKIYNKLNNNSKLRKSTIINDFEIPTAPHNTSQFLISNYINLNNQLPFVKKVLDDEYFSIDDMCMAGGSMRGLINSHYLEIQIDETDDSSHLSYSPHFSEKMTEEEIKGN